MNYAKILSIAFFVLSACFNIANAQAISRAASPAVWAWEVNTDHRKIYLLGELHGFALRESLEIDYQLGKDAYYSSSEVWTEVTQAGKQGAQRISSQISGELWEDVKTSIKKLIFKLSRKTNAEKETLYLQFINDLDMNDPYSAYASLITLAELNSKFKNPFIRAQEGMSKVFSSIDANFISKKIYALESDKSVADMWEKHCSDNQNLKNLISAGVANLDESYLFDKSVNSQAQEIFLSPTGSLDKISTLLLHEPAGEILNKCIVVARNKLWLPKILELAKTSGPPVTILVGVAHVSGSEGLLELLKKAGYKDIKRIYSIK